ncbi:hypothetical protein F2P79_016236 [Pimephales promelas]|nr:hypothetical protein F2P79_016236 [Pimephales promelas]
MGLQGAVFLVQTEEAYRWKVHNSQFIVVGRSVTGCGGGSAGVQVEGAEEVHLCPAAPPGVQDNLHGYDLDYRQDLDAIHTQYMTKVFWDPQWKASRREMLAGQMYLYTTPTSAFTWMADYYHVL